MTPDVITYASREAQSAALAQTVAEQLRAALVDKSMASLAVPGGTTPGPFLAQLSGADLPWDQVYAMLTDERFVPECSERSNTALLRRTLFQGPAAEAQLVPLVAEADAPEEVLDQLLTGLRLALPLDVCVLGMGADMHTASLFPGADKLDEALAPEVLELLPMRAPGPPEPRLTLTAPVLSAAAHVHLLITGAEKRDALEQALTSGPVEEAPVRALFTRPVTVHWAP
ncbi:MAG: 6-phosphogluconolactonase [Pseudomonadota bacterium]